MADETLINFGAEVKALGGGKVGGYLVKFSTADDPDLVGDFFTPETDFDLYEGKRTLTLYDHGLDKTIKRRKLGYGSAKVDDVGVWFEAQLEARDEYEAKILELVEAGKLGWSSGSAPHLVERKAVKKAFELLSWPIVEASLTPTPCEPRTSVQSLKSYELEREVEETKAGARNNGGDKGRIQAIHDAATEMEGSVCPANKSFTGSLAGLGFSEHLDAVLAATSEVTKRAREIHTLRTAEGRNLSADRRGQLRAVKSELDSLLEETTPVSAEGTRLYAEFLQFDVARMVTQEHR
jgi:phage head maturation protease